MLFRRGVSTSNINKAGCILNVLSLLSLYLRTILDGENKVGRFAVQPRGIRGADAVQNTPRIDTWGHFMIPGDTSELVDIKLSY
jgi:hypothetical protein